MDDIHTHDGITGFCMDPGTDSVRGLGLVQMIAIKRYNGPFRDSLFSKGSESRQMIPTNAYSILLNNSFNDYW